MSVAIVVQMSRTLTPRGELRRTQLIQSAIQLFANNGYHQTSISDIVNDVGVGKGVFYWYFESKDALFLEILKTGQRSMRRAQHESLKELSNPVLRIEAGIRAAVHWLANNNDLRRLISFARTERLFLDSIQRGERYLVADTMTELAHAIELGMIENRDPEATAYALLGLANKLTQVYIDVKGQDPERVADAVISFCRHGIGMLPNGHETNGGGLNKFAVE